jgi:hypothetical protein
VGESGLALVVKPEGNAANSKVLTIYTPKGQMEKEKDFISC